MSIEIKKCGAAECPELFQMTKELIDYHDMSDIFTLTEQRLTELVLSGAVHSYIAYVDGKPAAHINFFYKYTTFTGRKILYLEDLYTRSEFRGHGLGTKMFDVLKSIAKENECESIEWKCAKFNDSGKRFYERIGARTEQVWETYTIERKDF